MANAADSPLRMIGQQVRRDLQPFEGRLGMTWRIALLCALVAGTAMMHQLPESAISCYLIIFLMRPNGAECVVQALGLIVLVCLLVLALAPVIQALADAPLLRIVVIAGASFTFLYLGSATQLGEIGSIIGLVIAFILTMVDLVPAAEIVTRGLLYAGAMASMPMLWMAVFCLVLGIGPHTLVRRTIAQRLEAAATLLERGEAEQATALAAEGQAEVDKRMMMAQLLHTAPKTETLWLGGAAASAYRLLIAVLSLPKDVAQDIRDTLASQCRAAAVAIRARRKPAFPELKATSAAQPHGALALAQEMLEGLARPDGGSKAQPGTIPFVAADALTNPEHQQFALKTTLAALTAYFIYSLLSWEGIATAMVTCYVASLGTTGETVHKLALRICGCLIGAAMGLAAILFVMPHLTSVGGLMALVFFGILPAAWVASGSERMSYGGVQIGLAFLLTILGGFGPSTSMSAASDRVIGILLGNAIVFVVFTGFWTKSALVVARRELAGALAVLARLAQMGPAERGAAVNDIAAVAGGIEKARDALDVTPYEPHGQRPAAADVLELYGVADETKALLPMILFTDAASDASAETLRKASRALDDRAAATAPQSQYGRQVAGDGGLAGDMFDLERHAGRIGALAAGGQ
jgi:multidrug resistance protein MdtO